MASIFCAKTASKSTFCARRSWWPYIPPLGPYSPDDQLGTAFQTWAGQCGLVTP